jgi:hypothetical protein
MMHPLRLAALSLLCACATAPAPRAIPKRDCARVGNATDDAALAQLYQAQGRRPLIIIGNEVFVCSCSEPRRLAGATEKRKLAGATEERRLAGATEERKLAGATEERKLAGGTEERRLAGATEERKLAGAIESLSCMDEPMCNGYRVLGARTLRIYDGTGVREAPDGCVGNR